MYVIRLHPKSGLKLATDAWAAYIFHLCLVDILLILLAAERCPPSPRSAEDIHAAGLLVIIRYTAAYHQPGRAMCALGRPH